MSFLHQIEVLILTWNEEANLARTLDALRDFFALAIRPYSTPIRSTVCLAVPTAEGHRRLSFCRRRTASVNRPRANRKRE